MIFSCIAERVDAHLEGVGSPVPVALLCRYQLATGTHANSHYATLDDRNDTISILIFDIVRTDLKC